MKPFTQDGSIREPLTKTIRSASSVSSGRDGSVSDASWSCVNSNEKAATAWAASCSMRLATPSAM